MIGNNFQIYGVHIPRKYIKSRHFFSCPSWLKTRPPSFLSAHTRQKEITHSLRQHFFKNLFPPTGEREKIHWIKTVWLISLPTQNSSPSSCHHTLGRRKLLIPSDSILSKTCFPQQRKEVGETMICFIKIQSENTKMAWDIKLSIFCMIYNIFKCDGFQFCKSHIWFSMVLVLMHFLCYHNNLILKL